MHRAFETFIERFEPDDPRFFPMKRLVSSLDRVPASEIYESILMLKLSSDDFVEFQLAFSDYSLALYSEQTLGRGF